MNFLNKTLLVLLAFILGISWILPVGAVPAYARQTGVQCSHCHTAWPQLNQNGRQFKELGYRLPGNETVELADYLQDLAAFPLSGILISRPYDKKERSDKKLRALHEAEIIISGSFNKFSGFVKIEAEDETDFEPEVGPITLSYHHNELVNLQFLYAPLLWSDPYGLYGDHFRLTRGHVGVIDQTFEGADGKLRDNRQQIGLYGRIMDKVFYNVGWSGEAKDAEGVDASGVHGRMAVDITEDIMIGGFLFKGEDNSAIPNRNFMRWGIDSQVDFQDFRVQASYIKSEGDNAAATAKEDNNVFSGQALYTFKKETGGPSFVPLIRYDTWEKSDGSDNKDTITFNLGYYITENVKGYAEYFHEIDAFTGSQATDRFTLQFFVAF